MNDPNDDAEAAGERDAYAGRPSRAVVRAAWDRYTLAWQKCLGEKSGAALEASAIERRRYDRIQERREQWQRREAGRA